MKFVIDTVLGETTKLSEKYPVLKAFDYKDSRRNKHGRYVGYIKLQSLEDLIRLKDALKQPLVIDKLYNNTFADCLIVIDEEYKE